jgi:hypothetical protein
VLAGVAFVSVAVAVPLAIEHLRFPQSYIVRPPVTPPHVHPREADSIVDSLGPRSHLPPLLPASAVALRPGLVVDVGNLTEGRLRRTTGGAWQVLVRWDGRTQPLPITGAVALGTDSSWVSARGALYTRVATSTPGRFQVYGWHPEHESAYAPPRLTARYLGEVCFNASFTDFGDCARS